MNSLLLKDPGNLQAILLSSNIFQKQGNLEIALDIISAVNKEMINESIKHYMGLLYLMNSDVEAAYNCFREALKINPKYIPSMVECATILSTSQPDESIKVFKKVLKSEPKNHASLGRLAKIYEREKQFDSAIKLYRTLITMVESYGIYESLGFCETQVDNHTDAIQCFKKAITF